MANGFFNIDTAPHPEVRENVAAGILGAFLLALVGGLVYFVFSLVGFIAGISGFVAVFLAIKGYQMFAKKLSKRGIIIAVVIAFIVLLMAWYVSLTFEVFKAYNELYKAGDIAEKPSFFECFFLTSGYFRFAEFRKSAIINLVLSLLFAVLGSFALIANMSRQIKQNAQYAAMQAANNANNAASGAQTGAVNPTGAYAAAGNAVNSVYDAAYEDAANAVTAAEETISQAADEATIQLDDSED